MNKNYSITARLLFSFILLSLIGLVAIFAYFIIRFRVDTSSINNISISFLRALLLYSRLIPFALTLSVYFAFFYSNYTSTSTASKMVTSPLLATIFISVFYASMIMFFDSNILYEIENYNTSKEYEKYIEYENKLKNDAYNSATKAFDSGNLDLAFNYASESLFYSPEDVNVLILLKNIQEDKRRKYTETHAKEASNVSRYIALGTRAFSLSNYTESSRYFNNVLKIERTNPLALYYINKISLIQNGKPKYIGSTTGELQTYDRLSNAIGLYEKGNLWKAYDIISDLYAEYPSQTEVKNYYLIITESIRKYDFFMEDALRIKKVYVDETTKPMINDYSYLIKSGLNLMLDENTLLHASKSVFFRDNLYMFDVSLVNINQDFAIETYAVFKYGKLANSFTNDLSPIKNIILKGRYDANTGKYDTSNINENTIPVRIDNTTVYALKNYNKLSLDYRNIKELFVWHYEFPRFGYSNTNVDIMMLKKIIAPFYLVLLSFIIAYYSFRYRVSILDKKMHIYHRFIGFVGTLFLTLICFIFFNSVINVMFSILPMLINLVLIISVFLIVIFIYVLQMSRISKDVK